MSDQDHGFADLRAAISTSAARATTVSQWSVGMHIHHCGLAAAKVCAALQASVPPPPRSPFSLRATLVFLTGYIPRGRARAPEMVVPMPDPPAAELTKLLDDGALALAAARGLDGGAWVRHPLLGVFDRDRAMKFIAIHNRHHLKIIADIVAAS